MSRNSVRRAGSALNLSHAALNFRMQFLRTLPLPSVSSSRVGMTGINTPHLAFVLNADRADFDFGGEPHTSVLRTNARTSFIRVVLSYHVFGS
jgi:hypothetical protein